MVQISLVCRDNSVVVIWTSILLMLHCILCKYICTSTWTEIAGFSQQLLYIYDALMTTYLCILRVVTHCHLNDVHHIYIVTHDDDDAPSRYGDVTRTEESFNSAFA